MAPCPEQGLPHGQPTSTVTWFRSSPFRSWHRDVTSLRPKSRVAGHVRFQRTIALPTSLWVAQLSRQTSFSGRADEVPPPGATLPVLIQGESQNPDHRRRPSGRWHSLQKMESPGVPERFRLRRLPGFPIIGSPALFALRASRCRWAPAHERYAGLVLRHYNDALKGAPGHP